MTSAECETRVRTPLLVVGNLYCNYWGHCPQRRLLFLDVFFSHSILFKFLRMSLFLYTLSRVLLVLLANTMVLASAA